MTKNSCFQHGDYETDTCPTRDADKTPRIDAFYPLLDDLRARAQTHPWRGEYESTPTLRECVTLGHATMIAMSAYERGKKDAVCPMRCCEGLPKDL